MAGEDEEWVERSQREMLNRLHRGTDRTYELLRRSQERIRVSEELLGRSEQPEKEE